MQNIRLFEKETYYKSALTEICKSGGGGGVLPMYP